MLLPGLAGAADINLTSSVPSFDVGATTVTTGSIVVNDGVDGVITGAGGQLRYTPTAATGCWAAAPAAIARRWTCRGWIAWCLPAPGTRW